LHTCGKKTPEVIETLAKIMEYETAGDPVTGCKWTRKSTEKIAQELARTNIRVSPNTVARLLKDMNFSLRVNVKILESGSRKPQDPEKRDQQFKYIRRQRRECTQRNIPVISVDTKSRILLGRFHQKGRRWGQDPIKVLDHDFPSDAQGVAIPYGIYDTNRNEGFVCVGVSRDTGQFAVEAIRTWWLKSGQNIYPQAEEVLVLADGGGSNGHRIRLWKHQLQTAFCDRVGLKVRVCHYPPGASKWNPIEHRLFSFVSKNWEAEPLINYERVLKTIRTTKTKTGLRVRACIIDKKYETGIKISDDQMQQVNLKRYPVNPEWNYTITPSRM
jgi:hypothetical protein